MLVRVYKRPGWSVQGESEVLRRELGVGSREAAEVSGRVGREGTTRGGNKVQRAKFTGRDDGRVGRRPWHSMAAWKRHIT